MLDLQWTHSSAPAAGFQHLHLEQNTFLLFSCLDSVVILNARSLALVRVLPFFEVFPGFLNTGECVGCLSVDSGMKLIVVSINNRIAAWSLSGVHRDTWRVHSSLVLPDDHCITTLDCKSGLLAVGSKGCLSVYTLILENDLPMWSLKWFFAAPTPSLARFAPSLTFIATTSSDDNNVRLYSTTLGRQTQVITHPRSVDAICWRHSQASSRDDLILYTITSDSTLRIFLPVLDLPQHLQLHASLDIFSSLPLSIASQHCDAQSAVFWLDREVVGDALDSILDGKPEQEDGRIKRLEEIKNGGWDLFLRVLADGSVVISAVANIDRRPPTLLKQFTLQQSLPSTLPSVPDHLYLLPNYGNDNATLVTSPPLTTFDLAPLAFFDAQPTGLWCLAQGITRVPEEESRIIKLIRTPDGTAVGVVRSQGGQAWRVVEEGCRLVRAGRWPASDLVVVLEQGQSFVTYSRSDGVLTLHSTSPLTITIGPGMVSLFSLPSAGCGTIVAVSQDCTILQILIQNRPTPALSILSRCHLPLPSNPKVILPVDPMAWSGSDDFSEHDALLSVSHEGELAFWTLDENLKSPWRCTGNVKTGRTGFTRVSCSSAKKSALVVPNPDGEELSIWDSQESEFASGLEYSTGYSSSDPIRDLDWTSTPDSQSILAVGFRHHVEIYCQQRMTYFDDAHRWVVVCKIEIASFLPHHIADNTWLANGALLVSAGHHLLLYGRPKVKSGDSDLDLFGHVSRDNGPLMDYHPQMLLQCLLWEKVELVKEIIVSLADTLSGTMKSSQLLWKSLPAERFWTREKTHAQLARQRKRYTFLFDGPEQKEESDHEGFNRALVMKLINNLETDPLPHLTPNENDHLIVLIQTTLEIDEQRRSLDANGLRYLISMRSFYILNRRVSSPSSPQSNGAVPRHTGRRERLRYRDMIWAFYSESQDILLSASIGACRNSKMCWADARALGVAIWLNSVESLKAHLEAIARNEYMAGDNRDPTACALYYFALGKVKLVHGLWRQAAWHKEQAVMLKFLSNDFSEARWRTAALKNAYALLSKQRFEYAAAFFLLGGSLKDAVSVCIKQLSDFQLAIAIARVVEQSNEGPVLMSILNNTVIPTAFSSGNRWLASWAFWLLHRRDLAVRILVTPLEDLATSFDPVIADIGDSHYDDPSLALLFSQLRSKTLQAAQGTSEISGQSEFNFVLQIARVFCRMGCHVLALDLVRSWSFDRPSTQTERSNTVGHFELPTLTPSPTTPRRALFVLEPAMRRRSSIVIDVDIPSEPPTRKASPEGGPNVPVPIARDTIPEEGDLFARKAGLGSLMKTAKQDVKVPEFNMDAFF